jgi:hypothetical protein
LNGRTEPVLLTNFFRYVKYSYMEQHTNYYPAPAPQQPEEPKKPVPQRAAVNGLAVVGFIALILVGITLAIYAARYVPEAVSQLASAGSALSPKKASTTPATLSVVSGATSIPFSGTSATSTTISSNSLSGNAMPDTMTSSPSPTEIAPAPTATVSKHVGLYGYPDLATSALVTGYLANGTNQSFIPAKVIPAGARAAIQFTIANDGTNATGPWGFIAQLPESQGYVFTSPIEENMNPGGHILFTLGFDQVQIAPGPQVVTVQADPNNQIPETNEGNNSASSAFEVSSY